KEITVAARMGGGDINANPRLRTAVVTARQNSMPAENIDRAIKKGTGELEGVTYEEMTYEVYGAGGVASLVQVLTDNRTRKPAEQTVRLLEALEDHDDVQSVSSNMDIAPEELERLSA